jgi:hypothetical protein
MSKPPTLPLSEDWQEIPDGWAIAPGAEIRMDLASGKTYARRPIIFAEMHPTPAPDAAANGQVAALQIELSVNRSRTNKMPDDASLLKWARYNDSFTNVKMGLPGIAAVLRAGYAIACKLQLKPNHRRKKDNFASAQHTGLDFDTEDERSTLAVLAADPFIARYAALLYTTASHTPDKPRARVLFVLDEVVTDPVEYRRLTVALMAHYGTTPDAKTKDPARLWYGSKDCDLLQLGHLLPVSVVRQMADEQERQAQREVKAKPAPRPPEGQSVIEAYNRAHSIGELLANHGYRVHGERAIRPNGHSLSVKIQDGRSFHHSSHDPLGDDYWHTAFDIFCQLEHGGDVRGAVKSAAAALGMSRSNGTNGHVPALKPQEDLPAAAEAPGLEMIVTNGRQLRDVARDALEALHRANTPQPSVFVRGGALARHRLDEQQRPIIEAFGESSLRGRLARAANFVKRHEAGEMVNYLAALPPVEVVNDILTHGEGWPFPRLTGIIETPALRPDGTVITTPGYDAATGLYYQPHHALTVPPIPERPTSDQVTAALALLREPLADYPFADDASEANALALMLTAPLRPAIDGPVPMALINAPQPGTGKGLLVEVNAIIATGRSALMTPLAKGEELRKSITALLLEGATQICFDNLSGMLYSPILAAALTAREWKDRILGESKVPGIPQRAVWVATGNSIQLGGDLPRRCYAINLDARNSEPWLRTDFRHPHLERWVREHRGELIAAALTLARAWYAAGCPSSDTPALGSFPDWPRVVGGILAHAGMAGFLGNLRAMYEQADEESAQWEGFLLALLEEFKDQVVTVAEIAKALAGDTELRDTVPDLGEELLDAKGEVRAKFKQALGHAFKHRAGRRHGASQARVERCRDKLSIKVATWRILNGDSGDLRDSIRTKRARARGNHQSAYEVPEVPADLEGSAAVWQDFTETASPAVWPVQDGM